MILKSFELDKIDINKNKYFLFYGDNSGLINETLSQNFIKKFKENIYKYEEKEILESKNILFEKILTKSFFENEKLIIISRVTDKIEKIILEIFEIKNDDLILILIGENLEKKSKIRILFEKKKDVVCVPFYPDDNRSLLIIANNFFKKYKLNISQQLINLIVDRARGDRQNLNNELEKIQLFFNNKKKINEDEIVKLTNLAENYSISELVDACLAKNKKKIIRILSENNFSTDDTIIITRTFLSKAKRLMKLTNEVKINKNIDNIISSFRPPIFWKDKDLVKTQIKNWSNESIKNLIFEISKTEFLIKKNYDNSLNILFDFIFQQSKSISN